MTSENDNLRQPLGVMPRKRWDEKRMAALGAAISRRREAGLPPRQDWNDELKELKERY